MRETSSGLLACALAMVLLGGCSCSETGLGGDSGIDVRRDWTVVDPSFDPPVENLGDPGWRDSTEPWCYSGGMDREGWDIWSDSRGVFVVLELYHHESGSPTLEHTIYFNDGTGWGTYLTEPSIDNELCISALTGLPGGALFGWDGESSYCQLTTVVDGVERLEVFSVFDVFAVNEELAFAIPVGDPRIVKFEGGSWGPLPGDPVPYGVQCIWANEEVIFAGGPSGVMLSNEGGAWTVHDTRTMNDFRAVWGFSATDVWASTYWPPRLMHYDGESWEQVEWPDLRDPENDCAEGVVRGFWGKDGVLFFHTRHQLTMWDGVDFTVLGYWPSDFIDDGTGMGGWCEEGLWISSIWGNEVDEVFLAIRNSRVYDADCGEEFLMWWDGSEFHWF